VTAGDLAAAILFSTVPTDRALAGWSGCDEAAFGIDGLPAPRQDGEPA
jgi:hypothetical protein